MTPPLLSNISKVNLKNMPYIGNAIAHFYSEANVPITAISPSPSPVYGLPSIRRVEGLRLFQVDLSLKRMQGSPNKIQNCLS